MFQTTNQMTSPIFPVSSSTDLLRMAAAPCAPAWSIAAVAPPKLARRARWAASAALWEARAVALKCLELPPEVDFMVIYPGKIVILWDLTRENSDFYGI